MNPWYREPWPWIVMSGPAAVMVAGAITMWIAFATADGLVADDYYKQGLAINQLIARGETAQRLGIAARVEFEPQRIRVRLEGQSPAALLVHLAHATRAGHDVRLRLARVREGVYEADRPQLPAGRWRVAIEDPAGQWRIVKERP